MVGKCLPALENGIDILHDIVFKQTVPLPYFDPIDNEVIYSDELRALECKCLKEFK